MLQRIQTVFLALATVLDLVVFFNSIYSHAMEDPQAWIGIGFAVILTLAMLLSAACIFLYNNRKQQMRGVKWTTYLQIAAFGWGIGILFSLGGFGTFLWDESLGVLLLLTALIFQVLAYRNIKKDEELVQSMDRIR